ncbi:hypothetical protein GCM10027047_26150 [Rhodococcus aerolatus]
MPLLRPTRAARPAALLLGLATALVLPVPAAVAAPAAPEPTVPAAPAPVRATGSDTVPLADVAVVAPAGEQRGASTSTVRELDRAASFSMAALTWTGAAPTGAAVRARQDDGSWSAWFTLDPVDGGQDGPAAVSASEPVYVGRTTAVQVRSDAPDPAATSLVVLDPDDTATPAVVGASAVGRPAIISRTAWGADESLHCQDPEYADAVRAAVVHHTADGQVYTAAQSASIIRGIYYYHAKTLGWCDIGYHAIVDEFGQIFEGAAGGMDRPLIGAHAGGFNTGTVGVVMLGDYQVYRPTDAELDGVARYLAWQASLWSLDPYGSVPLTSGGGVYTPYPAGQVVAKPQIMGHRDVDSTACPGNVGYSFLPDIRDRTAALLARYGDPVATTTTVSTTPTLAVGSSVAVLVGVGPGGPSGTAAVSVDGAPVPGCEARPVAGGAAACLVRFAAAGPHTVTVDYSGGDGALPSAGTLAADVAPSPSLFQLLLGGLVDLAALFHLFGL